MNYKLKKILTFIRDEFIYGGHLQGVGTLSILLSSAILLNIKISWDVFLITYLMLYPIYSFNRLKEIEIDALTNPARTAHLKKYLQWMPLISYSLIPIFIFGLFYFSGLSALIIGLLFLILGFFYTAYFKKLTKKILFFKNFYVAAFFAAMVIFLLVYYSQPVTATALILMGFVFLNGMVMQITLDIKDTAGDAKVGLKTFPVIFGKDKTLAILKILSFSAILPIFFLPKAALMLALTTPFNFYCFNLAKQKKYAAYLLAGGEFILWAPLLLIGKFILW